MQGNDAGPLPGPVRPHTSWIHAAFGEAAAARVRKLRWVIGSAVLLVGAAVGGWLWLTAPVRAGAIGRGIRIAGIDVSGLPPPEARSKLEQALPSLQSVELVLSVDGRRWRSSAANLGAAWDVDTAVGRAMAVGREGDFLHGTEQLVTALQTSPKIPVTASIRRDYLKGALRPVAAGVLHRPRNATVRVEDPDLGLGLTIVPDQPGQRLDLTGSEQAIEAALRKAVAPADPDDPTIGSLKQLEVDLPLYRTPAAITRDMLHNIDGEVAEFTTHYRPWQVGRTHNLWLASSAINNTLLMPGKLFSYNRTVGQRRVSKGYRAAPIFVEGKVVDDTGGGVCQVATTVYNAALLADCRIVERNHHSMKTSYIQSGRDATVAWDALDLKFRNSRKSPILLTTAMGGGELTVRVWGHVIPGESVQVYTRDTGDGIITYRKIHEPDGAVVRQVVSRDPVQAIAHE